MVISAVRCSACDARNVASSCARTAPDGQPNGPVADGGHPRLGLAGRLEAVDAVGQGAQQRLGLQQREHAAHAGMHAVAEAQAAGGCCAARRNVRRPSQRRGSRLAAANISPQRSPAGIT